MMGCGQGVGQRDEARQAQSSVSAQPRCYTRLPARGQLATWRHRRRSLLLSGIHDPPNAWGRKGIYRARGLQARENSPARESWRSRAFGPGSPWLRPRSTQRARCMEPLVESWGALQGVNGERKALTYLG